MGVLIADMSDGRLRGRIVRRIGELRGLYRVEVVRYRPRRSDRQNRYLWPCFVEPFGEFLRAQGEDLTDLEAHGLMKSKFLRKTVEVGGERMDVVRSTTDLDTAEFNRYLDQLASWLAEMFDIQVPEPRVYREVD